MNSQGVNERIFEDFTQRFSDLSAKDFPDWITLFSLVDLGDVDPFLRNGLADLQNDASAAAIHRVKHQLMWLNDDIQEKYQKLTVKAVKHLLPFPSTYLIECAFSTVTYILTKKALQFGHCRPR